MPETITQDSKQTIEKLDHFTCQQPVHYDGDCGELADYRVRFGSLALTFCEAHAQKYIRGEALLKAVKCKNCGHDCKPGYIWLRDYGVSFCTANCQALWERQNELPTYR